MKVEQLRIANLLCSNHSLCRSSMQRCHSCGLEVKLETSIRGILLVVNGICPNGHVLHRQS